VLIYIGAVQTAKGAPEAGGPTMVFVYDPTAKTKLRKGGPRIGEPTGEMEIGEAGPASAQSRAGRPVASTQQLDADSAQNKKKAGEAAKAVKAPTGESSTTQRQHRPKKESCCEIM